MSQDQTSLILKIFRYKQFSDSVGIVQVKFIFLGTSTGTVVILLARCYSFGFINKNIKKHAESMQSLYYSEIAYFQHEWVNFLVYISTPKLK